MEQLTSENVAIIWQPHAIKQKQNLTTSSKSEKKKYYFSVGGA
jgi:hypothetical protein